MIKKVFFILMISTLFFFFSCGSTKQERNNISELEPAVETEESQELLDETNQEADEVLESQEDGETSEEDSNQTPDALQDTSYELEESEKEDIEALYPPLEEIEDPDLIDISPEEVEKELAATKEAEESEIKITEPVEETEELPPLPVTEEDTAAQSEQEDQEDQQASEGQEEDSQSLEPVIEIQTEEEAQEEEEILPSRSVTLKKGETLVITYPGNGWIYMGSTSEYNNLASRGRKLGTGDTKYTLLAKEAGTQIHHFYKVDNLSGQYIDDYIEVTVLEKKGNSSTVVNAPDYSAVVPKKPESPAKASPKTQPAKKEESSQSQEKAEEVIEKKSAVTPAPATTATTAAVASAPTPAARPAVTSSTQNETSQEESEDSVIVIDDEEAEETFDIEPLITKANSYIASKDYDSAYPLLIQYLEFSTDKRDLALYLLGQVFESNSKYRDIKQAVETYQTLCDSYPASQYWENANKRIVYLKRFYINIH